jgi:DNA modification methylase
MAILNYRQFLGFEVNEGYVQIAKRRLQDAQEYQRRMRALLNGTR